MFCLPFFCNKYRPPPGPPHGPLVYKSQTRHFLTFFAPLWLTQAFLWLGFRVLMILSRNYIEAGAEPKPTTPRYLCSQKHPKSAKFPAGGSGICRWGNKKLTVPTSGKHATRPSFCLGVPLGYTKGIPKIGWYLGLVPSVPCHFEIFFGLNTQPTKRRDERWRGSVGI